MKFISLLCNLKLLYNFFLFLALINIFFSSGKSHAKTFSINDIEIIVGDINGNSIDMYINESNIDTENYVFNINSVYPNPFNTSTDILHLNPPLLENLHKQGGV